MRKDQIFVLMLVILLPMSGCMGNADVETSEGDDVVIGESLDDWPTYYVPAVSDLPTCDSSTLGRLYYVEADTNFQACMSTGWEVVEIGGSNSNIILNAPPVLSAGVWTNSGYNSNGFLVDDGDGTMSVAIFMDWFAYDVDGTIASVGIDSDLDGIVDVTLPSDSGATDPQSSIQLANGGTMNGAFKLPIEEGVSITRMTDFKESDESPLVACGLVIQKSFAVIAEDNSGAKTVVPIVTPITFGDWYDAVDGIQVQGALYQALSISQADLDWLAGQGGSTCPVAPTFTIVDHPDSLTSSGGDNVATITIAGTADWSLWNDNTDYGETWGVWGVTCINSNTGAETWIEAGATFNGVDEDSPQDGDTFSIVDHSNGNCDTDTTHLRVEIRIASYREPISLTIAVS